MHPTLLDHIRGPHRFSLPRLIAPYLILSHFISLSPLLSTLSFSYGEFTDRYIDENGAGTGLRLQLRTADIQQASVVFNGSTLGAASLPSSQLRGAWRKLTIRHTVNGLTVLLDSALLFDNLRLPGFQPTVRWRLAIGARCGSRNDLHQIDDVHVHQGAAP